MRYDPARLFLWSGLVWHGAVRAYWVAMVVRITVELELPSLELVLMGTALETALLVAEVPTGVVADAYSRKWSIVVGFVCMGGAQVASGLVETFPLLVVTQAAVGIAFTFRSGADTAWITDELGSAGAVEGLVLRRARLQLVVSIGAIIVGAGFATLTSLQTTIVVCGAVIVATGLALAVLMPESGFRPDRHPELGGRFRDLFTTLRAGARVVVGSRALLVLAAVLVLAGLAGEAVDRLDIRRLDDLGLSDRYDEVLIVGVIAATEAALGAAVLWWAERRLVGRGVVVGVAALLGVSAVGIALLGLVAVLPVAAIGLMFQGGLRSAALPLPTTWANAHARSEVRATVHSFVEQASSLGEIGGGVIVGSIAAATTVPTALATSTVLIVAAALVALAGVRAWDPVSVA